MNTSIRLSLEKLLKQSQKIKKNWLFVPASMKKSQKSIFPSWIMTNCDVKLAPTYNYCIAQPGAEQHKIVNKRQCDTHASNSRSYHRRRPSGGRLVPLNKLPPSPPAPP